MKSLRGGYVTILCTLICILISTTGFSQMEKSKLYANDVSSVQNILDAYYDCISGPIGQKRDFERLKNLFDPNARLIYSRWNNEKTKASNLIFNTIDEFIERLGYLDKKGFYEYEVSNEIHTFSSITQVFSTYKFHVEDKSIPNGQGITSYDIFYDGERYWILSMLWAAEDGKHKIPKKYLD